MKNLNNYYVNNNKDDDQRSKCNNLTVYITILYTMHACMGIGDVYRMFSYR